MSEKKIKGTSIFRPRARIIETLGEQLISSGPVALYELIKNSYDADATFVEIRFEAPLKKQSGRIIIRDNGTGMSLETIKSAWMEPATNFKRNFGRTKSGRTILGEKGIGRFACSRLANKLRIITKLANDDEIIAIFDWSKFKDSNAYLDEIKVEWEARKPVEIENHGTLLILEDLIDDWEEEDIRELNRVLSRLINPIKSLDDFDIDVSYPEEYQIYSGSIESSSILQEFRYNLKGEVDMHGNIDCIYSIRDSKFETEINEKVVIGRTREPTCGSLEFDIRVWDRDDYLSRISKELGIKLTRLRQDLNFISGISIYRDGFRVFPYGEPRNDWLRLDIRRVNNPSMRLSNNQLVGYILINRQNNPALIDQSNREGLIQNRAYNDLMKIILRLLSIIEARRYKFRREKTSIAESIADDLFPENFFMKIDREVRMLLHLLEERLDTKDINIAKKKTDSIRQGIDTGQEVLARYRRLSTLGILTDIIIHDGNNALSIIDNKVKLIKKGVRSQYVRPKVVLENVGMIKNQQNVLSTLFTKLSPFSGRKRSRKKTLIVEDAIRNVFDLHEGELKRNKIKWKIPTSHTQAMIFDVEFQIVFVNLLQNSIYWLKAEKRGKRRILVNLEEKFPDIIILFSDNGPGVRDEYVDMIFDPYFSTKPDGIGLGLTIAGEIISEHNGSLSLLGEGPLEGATFQLIIQKEV